MRRLLVFLFLLIGISSAQAITPEDLSKQATAFYSDNNFQKTMELLLQIEENDRTAQDWLLLGNLLDEKGEKQNAIFMYQKAINTNEKYYKAYYNLANIYLADEKSYVENVYEAMSSPFEKGVGEFIVNEIRKTRF